MRLAIAVAIVASGGNVAAAVITGAVQVALSDEKNRVEHATTQHADEAKLQARTSSSSGRLRTDSLMNLLTLDKSINNGGLGDEVTSSLFADTGASTRPAKLTPIRAPIAAASEEVSLPVAQPPSKRDYRPVKANTREEVLNMSKPRFKRHTTRLRKQAKADGPAVQQTLEAQINDFIMERERQDPRRSYGKGRPRGKDKPDEEVIVMDKDNFTKYLCMLRNRRRGASSEERALIDAKMKSLQMDRAARKGAPEGTYEGEVTPVDVINCTGRRLKEFPPDQWVNMPPVDVKTYLNTVKSRYYAALDRGDTAAALVADELRPRLVAHLEHRQALLVQETSVSPSRSAASSSAAPSETSTSSSAPLMQHPPPAPEPHNSNSQTNSHADLDDWLLDPDFIQRLAS